MQQLASVHEGSPNQSALKRFNFHFQANGSNFSIWKQYGINLLMANAEHVLCRQNRKNLTRVAHDRAINRSYDLAKVFYTYGHAFCSECCVGVIYLGALSVFTLPWYSAVRGRMQTSARILDVEKDSCHRFLCP